MRPVSLTIPASAERFGYSTNRTGGHMARSMMLEEMVVLNRALAPNALPADYKRAIIEENALGKPTFASRDKSHRHLVELYGMDPSLALFRILRQWAAQEAGALPLMAMACTFCRDAQLRHSFSLVDSLRAGEVLPRVRMEDHLEQGFPGRFSEAMKKSLAQNVNTTWTHAGHLEGRSRKSRRFPVPHWAASAYAMFAGYLLGLRGEMLLGSVFSRLVGADPGQILAHLEAASARGWLRLRHAGGVIEIDFSNQLTPEGQGHLHGTD